MSQVVLKDRVSGQLQNARGDEQLFEGRWLLEQSIRQNNHTPLKPGDLLLDDGSPHLRLGTILSSFHRPRLSEDERNKYQLALDAIDAIDTRIDLAGGQWPSPLLPAELGRQSESTALEELLEKVFERGHLDIIARRPHLSMRYDTELLPVDRARRLDTGFQRHLAAHSECWAARTLSGVIPKSVLARVSEDDADIYEHRVYARLLDHLERYLRERISKLNNIAERYEQGLEFANSKDVDYRLRNDICRVWGESVSTTDATQLLERNRNQIHYFERWLKRIRSLKGRRIKGFDGGSLYQSIPRRAQVGLSLVPTNLLQHDVHYRQLRELWNAWIAATATERERPEQVLNRRYDDEACYEHYIGLLLLRVLHAQGFQVTWKDSASALAICERWGNEMRIENQNHCWSIRIDSERLVLVPSAAPQDAETAMQWKTCTLDDGHELRLPCLLQAPDHFLSRSPPDHLAMDEPGIRLSPLDLYAEERMHALVSAWLWRIRLKGYGKVFPRLPTPVVSAWPETSQGSVSELSLLKPVEDGPWDRLCIALDLHANLQLKERITFRKKQLDQLSLCPECASQAKNFVPSSSGFFAQCSCGCSWELRDQQFHLTLNVPQQKKFETLGRRSLSIEVTRP